MSESSVRLDPVDLLVAVGVGAVGAAAVRFLTDGMDRWWLPGLVGAAVGAVVAIVAPRAATPAGVPSPAPAAPPAARAATSLAAEQRVATPAVARPVALPDRPVDDDDDATTVVRRRSAPAVFETERFAVRSLSAAKVGNEEIENEDGLFVMADVSRLAVADGASSVFASRQWSQILTESFVAQPDVDLSAGTSRLRFVERCARLWQSSVTGGNDWWSNDARERGSFAAFLGVTIGDDLSVVADAVGDCCLFVVDPVRGLKLAFPLDTAAAFDSTPSLLSTNAPNDGDWHRATGRLTPGDTLVLASDAVAQWLLTDAARLSWLVATSPNSWLDELVRAREQHLLVNDDVTVVTVTCKGA